MLFLKQSQNIEEVDEMREELLGFGGEMGSCSDANPGNGKTRQVRESINDTKRDSIPPCSEKTALKLEKKPHKTTKQPCRCVKLSSHPGKIFQVSKDVLEKI